MNPASSSVRLVPEVKGFVLTDKLGSGTYATVYKAYKKDGPAEFGAQITQGSARDVVAVKCIERGKLTKISMENLLTEIEVMKELDHKHVVKLKDFEWNDKYIYLIMEFCSGGDLSSFIKNKTVLKESSARTFLRQLALALQFLRSKGIAHLDLKPQNLLLTGDRKVILKVGDFGMAQHLSAGDHVASFRGSPLYMAPEVMMGQQYDAKADLWSVGVILYEALFGIAPFASKTLDELEEKLLGQKSVEIPPKPEVSEHCKHLLQNLLQRDPNARISFDAFFNHPFIDLEHMPGPDSLSKAKPLVLQAVIKDKDGKISSAVNYYCQALEYFIPAIEFEEDCATREALRQKVKQYVERAEYLKEQLKLRRPLKQQPPRLLDQMKAENPKLSAALVKARLADEMELQQDYRKAFELYKEAVGILIPLSGDVSTREQKKLLKSEAQIYLNRAEEVSLLSQKSTSLRPCDESESSESRCRLQ